MDLLTPEEHVILKNSLLFQDLDENNYQKMIALAKKAVYQKGDILLKEDEISELLFVILSGEVMLHKLRKKNQKKYLIDKLHEGDSIGEMRIANDAPCILTAKASTPLIVLKLPIKELRKNKDLYNILLLSIIKILNTRLGTGNVHIVKGISQKMLKVKQLVFANIIIIVLALMLAEVGFAFYYFTNKNDFCNSGVNSAIEGHI